MSSLGWSFKSALATPIAIHAVRRHNAAKYWIRIEPHDGAHWLTNRFQGYAIRSGPAQAANFESLSDATELGRKSSLVFLPSSRDGPREPVTATRSGYVPAAAAQPRRGQGKLRIDRAARLEG